MKKIFIMFLVSFILIVTGCSNNGNTQNNRVELPFEVKVEKTNLKLSNEKNKDCTEGIEDWLDIKVDPNDFSDIIFTPSKTAGLSLGNYDFLFINDRGEILIVSPKKYQSTNSHVKKFNSKINENLLFGFKFINDENYWFLTNDFKLIGFNPTIDSLDSFNLEDFDYRYYANNIEEIKKMYDSLDFERFYFIDYHFQSFSILKNNELITYCRKDNESNFSVNFEITEVRPLPENTIQIYSNGLVKTNNDYYIYECINEKELNEYNDVEPIYEYVKLELDPIKEDILYFDREVLVTKDGSFYLVLDY